MFDTQEYLATVEPPKFKAADGTLYSGRILSVDEFEPIQLLFRNAKKDGKNRIEWRLMQKLLLKITDAFFPHPWYKPGMSVRDHVAKLPPVGQMRAVWDFMQSQRVSLGLERQIQQPIPGTPQPEDSNDTDEAAGSPTAG
jgi:hypothetical protein